MQIDKPFANMVLIPASPVEYKMGDVFNDHDWGELVHPVKISAFWMDQYCTTFDEYDAFCEATGKEKPDDETWGRGRRPVINVSWYDAVDYANWRSLKAGRTPCYTSGEYVVCDWAANGFRLPTEAEWEYAASWDNNLKRKTRFGNGKDIANPKEMNFDATAQHKQVYSVVGDHRGKTVEVGSFAPNSFGLYEMAGNVYQWCWDWSDVFDPESNRLCRGGSCYSNPSYCRVSDQSPDVPVAVHQDLGFRLVSKVSG